MVKFRCATRLIVFNEAHLLRILSKYARYYNEVCTLHTPDRAVSRHYRAAELWWATPSIRTNEFSGSQRASAAPHDRLSGVQNIGRHPSKRKTC